MGKLIQEVLDQQHKMDKAIEYIEMYCPMLDNETQPIWNKILKILGDKENENN